MAIVLGTLDGFLSGTREQKENSHEQGHDQGSPEKGRSRGQRQELQHSGKKEFEDNRREVSFIGEPFLNSCQNTTCVHMKKTILMLEPDEDDRYITREYFQSMPAVEMKMVSSSDELLAYLRTCGDAQNACPSLLLLNYDSTPQNAVEILSWIKNQKHLSHIPVVVLSGTVIPGIVRDCYAHGASSFIRKPALVAETDSKINSFVDYWFRSVELP